MLLIDAYNVLYLPRAQTEGLEIEGLCALLGASRYAGKRAVLVCDGPPPALLGARGRTPGPTKVRLAGVELAFSGHGRSADDEIEERLRAGGGAGLVLVSDDRRLKRAASRARARSMASDAFLSNLLLDRAARIRPLPAFAKDIPLDRYSTAHWMREFGLPPPALPGLTERAGRDAGPAPAPDLRRAPHPPPQPDPIGTGGGGSAAEAPDESRLRAESLADDPVIREAIEAWNGRLRLEDLDMERWLGRRPRRPLDDRR